MWPIRALMNHSIAVQTCHWGSCSKLKNTYFTSWCPLLIIFANSLDQDQVQQNVSPDLDPNCFTFWWDSWIFLGKKSILKKNQQMRKSMKNWTSVDGTPSQIPFWADQSICKTWSCYIQKFRRKCIYKKVHYFTFDLDLRSKKNMKRCPVSSTSYDLCTCEVWSCYVQRFRRKSIYKKHFIWPWPKVKVAWGIVLYIMWPMYLQSLKLLQPMVKEMHYQENTLFYLTPRSHKMLLGTLDIMRPMHQQIHYLTLWGQGHTKCFPVPSTSCNLCTSKVWYCYIPRLRKRCIYKKKHTKCCPVPSTSCYLFSFKVWSCYIQRLRMRCIYKKIQYLTFDLQGHMKCCPVPSTSFDLFSYKVWSWIVKRFSRCINKSIQYLTFDLGVKVTWNVAQYPLHHVTYSATKFKVATSNGLGGDTFTRDMTDRQTDVRRTDWCEINIPFILK